MIGFIIFALWFFSGLFNFSYFFKLIDYNDKGSYIEHVGISMIISLIGGLLIFPFIIGNMIYDKIKIKIIKNNKTSLDDELERYENLKQKIENFYNGGSIQVNTYNSNSNINLKKCKIESNIHYDPFLRIYSEKLSNGKVIQYTEECVGSQFG